jgi:hypothetical protein
MDLRPTSSSDLSPQTGELAKDKNIADVPLLVGRPRIGG